VLRWIAIGIGLLTAVLFGFIIAAIFLGEDFRAAWRDVFIVILAALQLIGAVLSIAILIALLYVVDQINRLARHNVMPKLDEALTKANEALDVARTIANNVRDSAQTATTTTTYVAERVVSPIIRISSLVTGVRAAATTLARRGNPDEPKR
jgi:enamine deaminase RidA (YjgF/YER057c/UK114 family)